MLTQLCKYNKGIIVAHAASKPPKSQTSQQWNCFQKKLYWSQQQIWKNGLIWSHTSNLKQNCECMNEMRLVHSMLQNQTPLRLTKMDIHLLEIRQPA